LRPVSKTVANGEALAIMNVSELKKWRNFAPLDWTLLCRVKFAVVFGVDGSEALLVTRDDQVSDGRTENCGVKL